MSYNAAQNILRHLTTRFIDQAPVEVAVARYRDQPDGSGGTKRVRVGTLPEQRVTLVEPSDSGFSGPIRDASGSEDDSLRYQLVAEWDADFAEGDEFDLDDHHYAVDQVMVANGYEVRALVIRT